MRLCAKFSAKADAFEDDYRASTRAFIALRRMSQASREAASSRRIVVATGYFVVVVEQLSEPCPHAPDTLKVKG